MSFFRSLTLIWPGLPWAWLRGSWAGLILATAFAICLNLCIISAWIWTSFIDLEMTFGIWTATAIIWIVSTVSAMSTFPQPLVSSRDEVTDTLFIDARDAYLAGDWLRAETKLQTILTLSPTDGEAQLLFGTLLRRVGRFVEAKKSLEKLERSDSGQPWQHAICHELSLIKRDLQERDLEENSEEIAPNTDVDSNVIPHRRKAA
ncbi:MAG: tetratricopeptide repeat protein [Pirellulales bacterium]|nr:tetratricopeptide repeat protein [Pirellulales bacterium]MDO7689046.1 tetratricopeptide repeat protein [Pirellulales bacterium]